jgi:hypothetical protein
MSNFLRIMENEVQVAALVFLAAVYVLRIFWIFRFKPTRERTTPVGSKKAGITYSMMNIAMPWAMESVRKKPSFYAQFVIFHLGVAAAISATFVIPYWPKLFEVKGVVWFFQTVLAAAFIVGLMRLRRRVRNPAVRLISTLDDFLSLVFMILYFGVAFLAIPNRSQTAEWRLILFFGLTAFLLVYVPFSKISHYLYYPFARYVLGKTMGHRGVFPVKKKRGEFFSEPPKK